MKIIVDRSVKLLSSLGLSCTLIILLGLLTWLGTLEQVHFGLHEVQSKYFESFFLVHKAGPLSIPLPGANLVLCVLFLNLLVGGMVRLRKGAATAGVLITHVGIALLLLSSFMKMYHSDDGHVTLFEGQSRNYFQSYYRWEISVARDLGHGRLEEIVTPQEQFADATGIQPVTLTSPDLPFDLEIFLLASNSRVLPKGPMFEVNVPVVDGYFLRDQPKDSQAEANVAGCYATVVEKAGGARQHGLLWGVGEQPWTVSVDGVDWLIDLRHERYPMPFTLHLDDFRKVDHPRTGMPKEFSSDVRVIENSSERPLTISMNEPLRDQGLVLFQASWGPSNARPGDPLFSTFSVVRNPADQYPLYACIVIAVGLLTHFSRKLLRYIRVEGRKS